MPSSKAWAILSVLFMILAGANLMIMGYYLNQDASPILYSLGRFLMAVGGVVMCGIMFQIMLTHERQKEITKAVNAIIGRGKKQ